MLGAPETPSRVSGFDAALRAGLLPPSVPMAAPQLLPGLSARGWTVLYRLAIGVGVLALLLVPVGQVVAHSRESSEWRTATVMVAALANFFVLLLVSGPWRTRRVAIEARAGYATVASRREVEAPGRFGGLWLLDAKSGVVLREPDRFIEPPGYYPSPIDAQAFLRWSGKDWCGWPYLIREQDMLGCNREPAQVPLEERVAFANRRMIAAFVLVGVAVACYSVTGPEPASKWFVCAAAAILLAASIASGTLQWALIRKRRRHQATTVGGLS